MRAPAAAIASFGVAAVAGGFDPPVAAARTIAVANEAQFAAAVGALRSSGGTIVLAPRAYRTLAVGPRSSRPLRIVGRSGARAQTVLLDHTQRVSVGKLKIAPRTGPAWLTVRDSVHVTLHDLVVTARGTAHSASLELPGSRHVTIRKSRFKHCGDRSLAWAHCLLPRRGSSHVLVEDNRFHDCLGCDFIHGRFRAYVTIRRNRFDRALPCRIGRYRCAHQDLIELFEGRWLRVEANRFGVYSRGGAQVYIGNRVDHARVVNNLFLAKDPLAPGHRPIRAITVGTQSSRRVLRDTRIVNNTILSGIATRRNAGSIKASHRYAAVPRRNRPTIANNVIKLLAPGDRICRSKRRSVRNVILHGKPCSRSDRVGDAHLDARARPTAESALLIDRASRFYAPRTDMTGRVRTAGSSLPDIGAYEYVSR